MTETTQRAIPISANDNQPTAWMQPSRDEIAAALEFMIARVTKDVGKFVGFIRFLDTQFKAKGYLTPLQTQRLFEAVERADGWGIVPKDDPPEPDVEQRVVELLANKFKRA